MENYSESVPVPMPENNKNHFLFEVTTFSKVLAAIIFITLPFAGFYVGMQFVSSQPSMYQVENIPVNEAEVVATSSDKVTIDNSMIEDSQPKLFQIGVMFETVNDPASIVYDKNLHKLVTDSVVTDNYFRNSFADTLVTSLPENSVFVVNIPHESIIYNQRLSDDGDVLYVSVFRTDKQLASDKNEATAVFVYDISEEKLVFMMSAPAYSIIRHFSSDELLFITTANCYACGWVPPITHVIDLKSGNIPHYKTLGRVYDIEFIDERTYMYTMYATPSYEGCEGVDCLKPGETFTESM